MIEMIQENKNAILQNTVGFLKLSVQFSSVSQLCLTLCDLMNRSTPGLPVHHQLPEFTQTHVHRVGDAIQPSHLLPYPSPPAFNLSYCRSFPLQWVSIPFSRESTRPRDWTWISCIADRFFTIWDTREALIRYINTMKKFTLWEFKEVPSSATYWDNSYLWV